MGLDNSNVYQCVVGAVAERLIAVWWRTASSLPAWSAAIVLAAVSFVAGIAVPLDADAGHDAHPRLNAPRTPLGNDQPTEFHSTHLGASITILPGVFHPSQATNTIMPLMADNAALFPGKQVLEIGAGSGIISLYAASLGAERVVSTDINPMAIETTRRNAAALGFTDVVEARLVPENDISAYAVIKPDERFDLILSNPPYALDLDAAENTAFTDRGDLGFSIVRGLKTHLAPGGLVILLYNSNFYHNVMVKFARHLGYEVRNRNPLRLTVREAETLFNAYLARLLETENIAPGAFRFDRDSDSHLLHHRVPENPNLGYEPLLPGGPGPPPRPGLIVIERRSQTEGR